MNFDKINFSKILIQIKDSYGSINQMAEKTDITAAYLSKLIRLMYDNAPSPEILKKIADNSNGVISYYELMIVCGYVDYENVDIDKIIDGHFANNPHSKFSINYQDLKNRTNEENLALENLFKNYRNILIHSKDINDFNYNYYTKDLSDVSKSKVSIIWGIYITYLDNIIKSIIPLNVDNIDIIDSENQKYYMCPVYGQISAGQPNWAEESIEGRIPLDSNLMRIVNPEEHYFLRVNGESMNKVVKNGAFALIHKQDTVENGEIAVVLVNGYNATLKKFTKQGDLIILEPQSDDESFETQVYDKTTPIQIIGKYVGKMEINK